MDGAEVLILKPLEAGGSRYLGLYFALDDALLALRRVRTMTCILRFKKKNFRIFTATTIKQE